MKCLKCGTEIENGEKICKGCGSEIISQNNINDNQMNDMNKEEKPNKPKNNKILIGLVIVIMVIIGLICFFNFNKTNEEVKENNETKENIDEDIVDSDKEESDNASIEEGKDSSSSDDDETDSESSAEDVLYTNFDDEHLYLSYLIDVSNRVYSFGEQYNYFFEKDSLTSKDVSDDIKIQTALYRAAYKNKSKLSGLNYPSTYFDTDSFDVSKLLKDEYITISKETITNYIYDIFGDKSISIKDDWYYTDNAFTFYYYQNQFYVYMHSLGVGGPMGSIKYYNKKFEKDGDKLYVTLGVIYQNYYSDDTTDFEYRAYSDVDNKNLLGTIDYNDDSTIKTIGGKSVDNYKNKIPQYKFTFTKNNNGYYTFNKVEKI